MTASTSTHTQPGKKTIRPSVGRVIASKYVDLLLSGFFAWVICYTFGWPSIWSSMTLLIFVSEWFWCRDRLNPTAGEYCLGIRYLTSSSSQVVADIQVVHNKLKLNGALLTAGVVELSLAILFFCGWTFLEKAVVWGMAFGQPLALTYWVITGFAFFVCSGYLLSGSKFALWVVPPIHLVVSLDLFKSYPVWKDLLQNDSFYPPWVGDAFVHIAKYESFSVLELFVSWSFFVVASLVLSRKHLVN